jgi:hypothetical protein
MKPDKGPKIKITEVMHIIWQSVIAMGPERHLLSGA